MVIRGMVYYCYTDITVSRPLVLLLGPRQDWRVAVSEAQATFAVTAMHKKLDFAE